MLLFINACVRSNSRTKRLADRVLAKKAQPITEVRLEEIDFPVADEAFLKRRDRLIENRAFDDSLFALARQFAEADEIVIAAPFWDLSFPAALKQYFEQINVPEITFCYTEEGVPQGLCKAEKLTFVTTSGGDFFPEEFINAICHIRRLLHLGQQNTATNGMDATCWEIKHITCFYLVASKHFGYGSILYPTLVFLR